MYLFLLKLSHFLNYIKAFKTVQEKPATTLRLLINYLLINNFLLLILMLLLKMRWEATHLKNKNIVEMIRSINIY